MPGVPSVKGAIFAVAVKELRTLLDQGVLTPGHLGRWLRPEDLPLVAEIPLVSGWYDVGALERVSLLLRDVVGGGSDDYLRELGRRAAQEVIASGRYPQLAYARRAEVQALADDRERFEAFGRDLRILTSLSASFFSFSRWTARQDPGLRRWLVEVSDARPYSEAILARMAGFVNEVAGLHGEPRLWYWERPRPDLVVFRMTRDI